MEVREWSRALCFWRRICRQALLFGFIQPNDGGNDVFVHISAVERAGLTGLAEGQKVNFEIKADKMRGKSSAENLSLA